MFGSGELILALAIASASPAAHPVVDPPGGAAAKPPAAAVASHIRTRGDRFEWVLGGSPRPIFFRGINLGAGVPGHFPGEFAITREDYARWLRFARELHANAIRVYTLHPPAFYEALREDNLAHPDRPLWLFQGVWAELPESNDLLDEAFTLDYEREIGRVVDAVHGAADLGPRPGHAAGRYEADASPWLAGWVLGREWEPFAVRETERRHPDATGFHGRLFTTQGATATETWLARICDAVASQELARYGLAHAVSFVNWPTLDVMRHATESEEGGKEAEHDEDAYSVDPRHIRPVREADADAGFLGYYASSHVYPYYPDFLNLDAGYGAKRDRHGACNYAGYLADLKAHLGDLPLLVAEYGVPSGRGNSHFQPQGLDHGGASEAEQGARDVRLLEDIRDAGASGAILFSMFDEWFKSNWLTRGSEEPHDRDPLWHNLQDAEEGFGLIAFDAPSRIRVDGDVSDWRGIAPYAQSAREIRDPVVRALYATSDQARLYLRLDLDRRALRQGIRTLGVSLDVLDPRRGDTRLPAPLDAVWSRGAEFVLIIDPGDGRSVPPRAELFCDRQMSWSAYARARDGATFRRHEIPMRPVANHDGRYLPLVVNLNRARVGRDGRLFPGIHLDAGRLAAGREARPAYAAASHPFDPRSDWWIDRGRGVIEIALPWALLNIGDPSSRAVLDDDPATPAIETRATPGIGLLAWATRAHGFRADSLGPAEPGAPAALPGECHFLGAPGTRQTVAATTVQITSPDSVSYSWSGWERPITTERTKLSATHVRRAFEGFESREKAFHREYNALLQGRGPLRRPRRARPRR
ncbi:MAG TPA: hypothetical protein VJY35_01130 [Candidatus Eisenbacteria bacterium]|nr:hypothetical protein [Candidatus Eisenbacteria bacterium]